MLHSGEEQTAQENKQPILISTYNFKGGVGKTTATYSIAHVLSTEFGLRVLMVDADPQSSLTGLVNAERFIDYNQATAFYQEAKEAGEKEPPVLITMGEIFQDILSDIQPKNLNRAQNIRISPVHEYKNLFYVPGNLSISDMDMKISLGIEGIGLYKNFPGYVTNLFRELGRINNIDVILFDLSPNFGVFNGSIIMGSDYFFIPFSADFLSLQAMQSLQHKIPTWKTIIHQYDNRRDSFGLLHKTPKFLGAYPQKVRIRKVSNVDTYSVEQAYATWISLIYQEAKKLSVILSKEDMSVENYQFNQVVGIVDCVSVALDVQASGRPITDLKYSHKHLVSPKAKKRLTGEQSHRKVLALNAYKKVIGTLLKNLSQADLVKLSSTSAIFAEKISLFSDIKINVKAEQYIAPPTPAFVSLEEGEQESIDHHLYKNEEIDKLLNHYFSESEDVYWYRAISATAFKGAELYSALKDIHNGVLAYEGTRSTKEKAVIPVNLGNSHWVLIYIRYRQDGSSPDFYYFDPLGKTYDPSILSKIKTNILKIYKDAELLPLDQRLQDDNYNCGPWIIEAALSLTKHGALPDDGFNINQRREIDEKILRQITAEEADSEEGNEDADRNEEEEIEYELFEEESESQIQIEHQNLSKSKEKGKEKETEEELKRSHSSNRNIFFSPKKHSNAGTKKTKAQPKKINSEEEEEKFIRPNKKRRNK